MRVLAMLLCAFAASQATPLIESVAQSLVDSGMPQAAHGVIVAGRALWGWLVITTLILFYRYVFDFFGSDEADQVVNKSEWRG